MQEQINTIRDFVHANLNGAVIADDEDIFASGYVNSLFVVQLVMFVEQAFGLRIAGDDLDIRNLATIEDIDRLVSRTSRGPAMVE
jgi:methoxymalonate biosynthesis acyl carrier protein